MANQETILFAPEISERDLDKEVDNVNQQLEGVGEDVPVNFDADEMDMDGLMPAGAGGGGGGMGPGGAAGAGALASKIPKSVAGVTAAAALPVALAGGVGVGLLSAMQSASARLQTSSSLLGIAVDNFFREPGNILDEFIVRPIVNEILNASLVFDEAIRDLSSIGDGMLPDNMDEFERRADAAIDVLKLMPGPVGSITSAADDAADVLGDVASRWPGWPDVSGLWPGWPDLGKLWPGWPDIGTEWPGWPDLGMPEWPSSNDILSLFPSISVGSLRDAILGDGDAGGGVETGGGGGGETLDPPPSDDDGTDTGGVGRPRDGLDPGRGSGGGETPDPSPPSSGDGGDSGTGGRPRDGLVPSLQSGGRIGKSGIAEVHRGELVADPDRLVSELASAVSQASGGGQTRRMDTSGMERRLDQVVRRLQRLENAFDVTVEVDGETIARASANGKKNRVSDSNQLV